MTGAHHSLLVSVPGIASRGTLDFLVFPYHSKISISCEMLIENHLLFLKHMVRSRILAGEWADVRDVRAKEMFPAASLLFRHRLGCLQEADMLHDFLDFLHVDWLRGVGVAAELEGFLDIVDV